MYYKYDKDKSEKIKEINSKITEAQKQIFDTLLKISKSFSDESITKKERNESFKEVDILRIKIKEYNNELKEISVIDNINADKNFENSDNKKSKEVVKVKNNEEIENTINELEDTLKEFDKNKRKGDTISIDTLNKNNEVDEKVVQFPQTFSRKKARTQLVVVEEDDGLSRKIKGFFKKLKSMINK